MTAGSDESQQIDDLLAAYRDGDRAALERLVPILYDDFKQLARRQLRRDRPGQTLNTTALVNEAYLKLRHGNRKVPGTQSEFLGLAACVMRGIIVDNIRARLSAKRGDGVAPLELDEQAVPGDLRDEQVLALDDALITLAEVDADLVRVVECKFFAGYSGEETAVALDCSRRTVQRDWKRAKALIASMLTDE